MHHTLSQKRGWSSRNFTLYPDRILVESKDIRQANRYEISLDQLGLDVYYHADNTTAGKIVFGITSLIAIGSFIGSYYAPDKDRPIALFNGVLFTFISLLNFLKPNSDDVYLTGGERNLVFYRDKPNEKTVLEFINEIRAGIKSFLKEKYTAYNRFTSEQEYYSCLYWLLDKGLITETEFQEYEVRFNLDRLL